MLQRFGNYVVNGIDAEKNIVFVGIDKEAYPSFILLNESILPQDNGDVSYELAFETEEVTEEQETFASNSVKGFLKSSFRKLIRKYGNKVPAEFPNTGLNYIDRPVFSHFMKSYLENECFGGMTIATIYDPQNECFLFGVARCSDSDQYVKRIGNNLAYKNLLEKPIRISKAFIEETILARGSQPGVSQVLVDPCKFIKSRGNKSLGGLIQFALSNSDEHKNLYKEVFLNFRDDYYSRS